MSVLTRFFPILLLVSLFSFGGCGDDGGGASDTGAGDGGDAGPTDSGRPDTGTTPRDSGSMDSGPADMCATDDATETVGCNGPILGASQTDDEDFGLCTPDDTTMNGSCTDTSALCYAFDANQDDSLRGVCVPSCTPNGDTYVNTSTCPSGTRCFAFESGVGFCFADCNASTDCPSDQCDGDNTCVGEQAGMTDGGVDGGTDGGADGGVDGGADAGMDGAVDGGADAGTDAAADATADAAADATADGG